MNGFNERDQMLNTLSSALELALALDRAVMSGIHERGGDISHLRRLLSEPDLLAKVLDLIVPTDVGGGSLINGTSTLPPNHYRIHVTYAPLPSLEELKQEWGEDRISTSFDGRQFQLHESCIDMDSTPGDRVFYIADNLSMHGCIDWGLKQRSRVAPRGYRPATHIEVYEFAKAHPELSNYVGHGSYPAGCPSRLPCVRKNGVGVRRFGCGRLSHKTKPLFVCR